MWSELINVSFKEKQALGRLGRAPSKHGLGGCGPRAQGRPTLPPPPGFCPVLQQGIHAPGDRSKLFTQVPLKMSPEHRLYEVTCPGGTWEARAPVRSQDACVAQPFFTRPLVGHAHRQQLSSFPSPETHFPSKLTSTARPFFSLCPPASTCLRTSLHSFYLLSLLLKTKILLR